MAIALGLTVGGALTDLLGIDATISLGVGTVINGGPAPFTVFGGDGVAAVFDLSPLLDSVPGGANEVVAGLAGFVAVGHPSLVPGADPDGGSGNLLMDLLDNTTIDLDIAGG